MMNPATSLVKMNGRTICEDTDSIEGVCGAASMLDSIPNPVLCWGEGYKSIWVEMRNLVHYFPTAE